MNDVDVKKSKYGKSKKDVIIKTPYQVNKETFLEELYDNPNTLDIMFDIWQSLIRYVEEVKRKDLYDFSSHEVEALIMSAPTASSNRKNNLRSFINMYCEWAVNKGLINRNPCEGLDNEKVIKASKKAVKKNLYSFDEVYKICQKLSQNGSIFQYLPLILARYGITGVDLTWMCNLKWSDIEFDKKIVHIIDVEIGEYIKEVKVDERFLELITIAKNTEYEDVIVENKKKKTRRVVSMRYIDNGYVLKKREDSRIGEKPEENEIYRGIKSIFSASNMDRITFKDLVKSRKIELLLDIRENRRLTTLDAQEITEMLNPRASRGGYLSLKRDYESVSSGDRILPYNSKTSELHDPKSKEFTKKLRMELFRE